MRGGGGGEGRRHDEGFADLATHCKNRVVERALHRRRVPRRDLHKTETGGEGWARERDRVRERGARTKLTRRASVCVSLHSHLYGRGSAGAGAGCRRCRLNLVSPHHDSSGVVEKGFLKCAKIFAPLFGYASRRRRRPHPRGAPPARPRRCCTMRGLRPRGGCRPRDAALPSLLLFDDDHVDEAEVVPRICARQRVLRAPRRPARRCRAAGVGIDRPARAEHRPALCRCRGSGSGARLGGRGLHALHDDHPPRPCPGGPPAPARQGGRGPGRDGDPAVRAAGREGRA